MSQRLDVVIHSLRRTPTLVISIVTSICFTVISTIFNLCAIRRGALIVGEVSRSGADNLRRVPARSGGLITSGPMRIHRTSNHFVTHPSAVRGVVSGCLLLLLLLPLRAEEVAKPLVREYHASAYVTFLSVTIFTRSGVGGGFASLEETGADADRHSTVKFLSGSTPERTNGLNRLGYIQEEVDERDHALNSVRYFGFITANKEESLAQAKAALSAAPKGSVAYVAAEGVSNRSSVAYSVRNMLLPGRFRWSDSDELLRTAGATFASAPESHGQTKHASAATDTFLDALVRAIRSPDPTAEVQIIHNGKLFRLETEKSADAKIGEELQHQGLLVAAHCDRLKGTLRPESGSKDETTFRLWYDRESSNPLPARFEFRPRSFLRLVFDAVPESSAKSSAGEHMAMPLPSIPWSRAFAGADH